MKMTYSDALTLAINTLTAATDETSVKAVEKLTALKATYDKKAEQSAKRKAATAAARAEMTAQIIPILRDVITADMTAKEIYAAASDRLPANMTAAKVQNILLREMAPELVKTETKGKANTYRKV